MKALFLSNTTIDPVVTKAAPLFEKAEMQPGFDTWHEEIVRAAAGLSFGSVFLIIDGFSLWEKIRPLPDPFAAVKEMCESVGRAVHANPSVTFFLSVIEIPDHRISLDAVSPFICEDIWNSSQIELSEKSANAHLFDMRQWVFAAGRDTVFSMKLWYLGGIRYSVTGQKLLLQKITQAALSLTRARKKCLILDADNTLWGGIIGEDGMSGIQLSLTGEGARYYHFQRTIREIAQTGIICAIVSKNNEADLKEALSSHPHMLLREDFFVSIHANWNNKADEIRALALELNIGLDAMVFIDDNPLERELVKASLPDVVVPDFPVDTADLPAFMRGLYLQYFYAPGITDDDRARTALYKQNAQRQKELASTADPGIFLAGLNIRIMAKTAAAEDVVRIAQLCNKTNQFNLTTKRYTEAAIAGMMADSSFGVYSFSAEDKFGAYGIISVVIIRTEEKAILDTFLMSCRAMGKNIEFGILSFIFNECLQQGSTEVIGRFIPTAKNAPVKDFYHRAGFEPLSSESDEEQLFRKSLPAEQLEEFQGQVIVQ
jgi:FkbH-like protein